MTCKCGHSSNSHVLGVAGCTAGDCKCRYYSEIIRLSEEKGEKNGEKNEEETEPK